MGIKTGAKRHTHKYHRIDGVWMCALSNCTHYMPKNVAGNVAGKSSICWECAHEFTLDDVNMRDDKPKCPSCSNEVMTFDSLLKEKGI